MKYIIFPDIHGRSFWKDTVEAYKDIDEKITYIFLGDYLDPYSYEEISMQNAIDNFKDILKFQLESKDNVVLLLGNHDLHYISTAVHPGSRFSYQYENEIHKIFKDALEGNNLLQMTYECRVNGKLFLFSHAGILMGWVNKNKKKLFEKWQYEELGLDEKDIDSYKLLPSFNYMFESKIYREAFLSTMNDVSIFRGGSSSDGSMVWADWHEFITENPLPGIVQVFGHTQQEQDPININDSFYCLDVRRPFLLSEEGIITEIDGRNIPQINVEEEQEKLKKYLDRLSAFFF